MNPELKRLAQYVRYCRKHGVKYYKSAEFEFCLEAVPQKLSRKTQEAESPTEPLPSIPSDVTKSPFLLWSSPDFGLPDNLEEMNRA